MYARITKFQVNASRREEATQISDTRIAPGLRQEPGFRQMYAMIDPDSGDGLVLTVWESEDAEEASRRKVGLYFVMLGDLITVPPTQSELLDVVGFA